MRLPRHVLDLREAARAASTGDPAARAAFERAVQRWESRIDRLGQGRDGGPGAHTVRSSTQRLVDELREARHGEVDRIVDRWVLERARYQARQIARHETIEAYRDAYEEQAAQNPAVVGFRWTLSPQHPRPDVCDLLANQDLYGLGPGGYPPDQVPDTPHPNCLCTRVAIVDQYYSRRELARLNGDPEPPRPWESGTRETAAEWLAKQPEGFQKQLLGPTRARIFQAEPGRVLSPMGEPIPVHRVLGLPPPVRRLGPPVDARPLVQADRARMVQPFPPLPGAPSAPADPSPVPTAPRTWTAEETLQGITGFQGDPSDHGAQQALRDVLGDNVDPDAVNRLTSLPGGFQHRRLDVHVGPSWGGSPTLSLVAEIEETSGEYAGRLVRTLTRHPDGRLEAHHDYFVLARKLQRGGLGQHVLRNQLRSYLEWGVNEITVDAAWSGKYVWARMGFEWDTHTAHEMGRRLRDFLTQNVPTLTAEQVERWVSLTSDAQTVAGADIPGVLIRTTHPRSPMDDPADPPIVADEPIGRAFLLTHAPMWSGRVDLSPGSPSRRRYARAVRYEDVE